MFEIERSRHHQYYRLEVIRCYPTPQRDGGTVGWMLEGEAEGAGRWTEDEITQVNLVLSQFPQGPSSTYWYLWKKPASSIDSDQRPTYSIDHAIAARLDYVHALHYHDLTQLLRGWAIMQQNGQKTQDRDMGAYVDDLFAASPDQLQQMLAIMQEKGVSGMVIKPRDSSDEGVQ